jgi:hypothetical protein
MNTSPLRPQFAVTLACPSTEVLRRLCERLERGSQKLRRTRVPGGGGGGRGSEAPRDRDFFVLTVPETEQRIYSPWLTVEVEPEGKGSRLKARFGPHPQVWTGFAFVYLASAVTFLFSLAFAAALMTTGGSPWSLYISAGTAALMVILFAISRVGQRLSRGQMAALQSELLSAVKDCALDPVESA